jgi:hypothetical protein
MTARTACRGSLANSGIFGNAYDLVLAGLQTVPAEVLSDCRCGDTIFKILKGVHRLSRFVQLHQESAIVFR